MSRYRKRWGQVFLINIRVQRKIADYVNNSGFDHLVEIGPGKGAITRHIVKKKSFRAIEVDSRFVGYLRHKFPDVSIIYGDFLSVDLELENKTLLFGNLPYNIVPQILFRFLSNSNYSSGVFMVQKECFETMSAKCGSHDYSSFSVMIQSFLEIKKVFDVSRDNFSPVPKVDSTVVSLYKKNVSFDECKFNEYSKFVRNCFVMPRKTLKNNLNKISQQENVQAQMDSLAKPIRCYTFMHLCILCIYVLTESHYMCLDILELAV